MLFPILFACFIGNDGFFVRPFMRPFMKSNLFYKKYYPYSNNYFEQYIKRLNSKNVSIQERSMLNEYQFTDDPWDEPADDSVDESENNTYSIIITEELADFDDLSFFLKKMDIEESIPEAFFKAPKMAKNKRSESYDNWDSYQHRKKGKKKAKSENFEVVANSALTFADIGGYDSVKQELLQCVDILANYSKYKNFNIRIPKGMILEGPPGNGKTMLAKGFAGESNASFIAVSGSEFQEKYVGIGSSRVKELFELAQDNIPCIIFIDEIDAIGRKRSGDSESSSSERDNTLNQLLVNMDGFSTVLGIFVIGATNRADLLDPALLRPGRIDKRVFIGMPDSNTREAILKIHLKGKPHDESIVLSDMVDLTMGLSGAQIENVLNEAMLYAIRNDRFVFTIRDVDEVMNRILAGWQPTDHQFTTNMIEQIAIHEMGHAIVGLLARHHSKMTKIVINLSSPQSPGYTVFETSETTLYTRDALFEHLMILLAGRIAEEVFYNISVTTGAINDFEEALKLSEKMILYYGMGKTLIYPSNSEKYKEMIDNEVIHLIHDAYRIAHFIVRNCKTVIQECAELLQKDKILRSEKMMEIIQSKYPEVFELYTG